MGQQDSISPIQLGTLPLRLLALAAVSGTLLAARPALAVEWQTYLKEDFSEEKSMFYTGQAGEAFYRIDPDGRYIIDGLETASDSLSALTDKLYYYYAEASCEVLESSAGDLAFCGVIFHYHKTGDGQLAYYVFYTYGDGYYGAKRVEGEQSDIIIPLAKSSLVNAQGGNILGVDAQGSRFDLYINGNYADGFTDTGVDGGGFGFYVSKHSLGAFDDFIVRIEKRDSGKELPEAPSVAEGGEGRAKDYFDGYHPPEIPRDPDRPLYPWEVGYDKSQKARKKKAEGEEGKSVKAPEQKGPKESRPGAGSEKKDTPKQSADEKEIRKEQGSDSAAEADKAADEPKESRPAPPLDAREDPVPSEHGRDKEARPGGKTPADESAPPEDDAAAPADGAAPGAEETGREAAAAAADPDAGTLAEDSPVVEASPSEGPVDLAELETASEPELPFALDAGAPSAPEPVAEDRPASYEKPSANSDGSLARGAEDAASAESSPEATDKGLPSPEPDAKQSEPAPPAREKAKRRGINIREDDWETPRTAPVPPAPKAPPEAAAAEALQEEVGGGTAEDEAARTAPAAADAQPAVTAPAEEPQPPPTAQARPGEAEPGGTALSAVTGKSESAQPDEQHTVEAKPEVETPEAESAAPGSKAKLPSQEAATPPPDNPPLPRVDPPLQTPSAAQETGSLPADAAADPETAAIEAPQDPAGPPANPYYGGASEDTPLSELLPDYQPASAADTPLSALLGESGGAEMDELPMPLAPADPLADGAPGLVKLDDSFDTQRWPVSQSATASYAYLNGRYNIDNQHAETMAISYQEDNLRDCAVAVEALGSGDPAAGFGLAARFLLNGGSISYYGLFLSEAGDFLLLKVLEGKEYVLRDWSPAPERSGTAAWRLALECRGREIRVLVNGRLCATLEDSDIASGGYALLGGPGASASFDNFSLRGQR